MSRYVIHNDELKHYGVPGMKWGVRRERAYIRRAVRKSRFGPEQNAVMSKEIEDREALGITSKALKISDIKKRRQFMDDFYSKYRDMRVDAWMKDNKIRQLSELGREYVKELLYKKSTFK